MTAYPLLEYYLMFGDLERLKTKNSWQVIRTLKIGLHGQNHAILSSVKVSEGHSLI